MDQTYILIQIISITYTSLPTILYSDKQALDPAGFTRWYVYTWKKETGVKIINKLLLNVGHKKEWAWFKRIAVWPDSKN